MFQRFFEKKGKYGRAQKIDLNDLPDLKPLANGSYGNVYSSVLDGRPVAVKVLSPKKAADPTVLKLLQQEIELHSYMDHPNIVKCIGYGESTEFGTFLVTELADGGTLADAVAPPFSSSNPHPILSNHSRGMKYSLDLARAMAYTHENRNGKRGITVVHRDLKAANIVFTKQGVLKVIDFGLATTIPRRKTARDTYNLTGHTGSVRYMAPEVYNGLPYNETVDVYSWAVLAWQMASRKLPYTTMDSEDYGKLVVNKDRRPRTTNQQWPNEFSELLKKCWDKRAYLRPSFTEIIAELESILTKYKIDQTTGALAVADSPRPRRVKALVAAAAASGGAAGADTMGGKANEAPPVRTSSDRVDISTERRQGSSAAAALYGATLNTPKTAEAHAGANFVLLETATMGNNTKNNNANANCNKCPSSSCTSVSPMAHYHQQNQPHHHSPPHRPQPMLHQLSPPDRATTDHLGATPLPATPLQQTHWAGPGTGHPPLAPTPTTLQTNARTNTHVNAIEAKRTSSAVTIDDLDLADIIAANQCALNDGIIHDGMVDNVRGTIDNDDDDDDHARPAHANASANASANANRSGGGGGEGMGAGARASASAKTSPKRGSKGRGSRGSSNPTLRYCLSAMYGEDIDDGSRSRNGSCGSSLAGSFEGEEGEGEYIQVVPGSMDGMTVTAVGPGGVAGNGSAGSGASGCGHSPGCAFTVLKASSYMLRPQPAKG